MSTISLRSRNGHGEATLASLVFAVCLLFLWRSFITPNSADSAAAQECPVTPSTEYGLDDPFPANWYGDDDLRAGFYLHSLGVWYAAPEFAKVHWLRPAGDPLTVEGRRLDAAAPPLAVRIPAGYERQGFQVTALTFPTPGCWEVVGRIPTAELRFVVEVHPGDQYRSTTPVPDETWDALERPFVAQEIATADTCPRTAASRADRAEGAVLGDGPVSVQGLGEEGRVRIAALAEPNEPLPIPIRFIAEPASAGPLLIRQHRLDGPEPVILGPDGPKNAVKMWGRGTSTPPDWRVWRGYAVIAGPGCYALQIDGRSFTTSIVFEVLSE